ncbi:MAG: lysine-arginine-ornithine-binding protein [Psychromonas sp.]|jgi:lysine-arginine-ornithine-binding protein
MKKKLLPLIIAAVTASSMSFATETVRLGVEPGYAPFEIKKPDGSLAGFDIDLGNEICKRIEAQCSWIESDFDGLIPSLKAKKIDAILSAMSITPARLEEIAFSHKLYGTPARLVTAKGVELQPTAASLGGKRIGVFQGTTAETYAKEQWAVKGVDVVTYQSQDLVYADLINGRLDGAFQDAVAADDGFLKRPIGKRFQFSGPEVNNETYFGVGAGIGMRHEDSELKAKIDQAIDSMLADGTYSEIASQYFDFDIYGK